MSAGLSGKGEGGKEWGILNEIRRLKPRRANSQK